MNKKYELAVNLQQDFTTEEQAQGRANIGAVSAADVELAILSYASLAPRTLRFTFSKMDYDPTVAGVGRSGTWKKVSAKFHNVWDWTASGTSFANAFESAFASSDNLVSVIAAGDTSAVTDMGVMFASCTSLTSIPLFDTSAVTNMGSMFTACTSLTNVPLFDTSAVTDMQYTFAGCTSLTSIPLFDASAVPNMRYTFAGCTKVEGGALALYQQASTQSIPPSEHERTFDNCGKDTVTGAAELAQIPASWGGTAP